MLTINIKKDKKVIIKKFTVNAILAHYNGEIGVSKVDEDDFKMFWNIKNEMKFFKETTTNNIVVMGSNTYKSIGSKPLKNRINFVFTSKPEDYKKFNAVENAPIFFVSSVEEMMNELKILNKQYVIYNKEIFVIGGAKLYSHFLPYYDSIYVSTITNNVVNKVDNNRTDFINNDYQIIKLTDNLINLIGFKDVVVNDTINLTVNTHTVLVNCSDFLTVKYNLKHTEIETKNETKSVTENVTKNETEINIVPILEDLYLLFDGSDDFDSVQTNLILEEYPSIYDHSPYDLDYSNIKLSLRDRVKSLFIHLYESKGFRFIFENNILSNLTTSGGGNSVFGISESLLMSIYNKLNFTKHYMYLNDEQFEKISHFLHIFGVDLHSNKIKIKQTLESDFETISETMYRKILINLLCDIDTFIRQNSIIINNNIYTFKYTNTLNHIGDINDVVTDLIELDLQIEELDYTSISIFNKLSLCDIVKDNVLNESHYGKIMIETILKMQYITGVIEDDVPILNLTKSIDSEISKQ